MRRQPFLSGQKKSGNRRKYSPQPLLESQLNLPLAIEPKQGSIDGIKSLYIRTWGLYLQRAPAVLLVMLLGALLAGTLFVALLQTALQHGLPALGFEALDGQQLLDQILLGDSFHQLIEDPVILVVLGLNLLLVLLLASWWLAAVLVAVVKTEQGIFASLCLGGKYLVALLWINTLWLGIMISASLLLLLVGGLFLLVSFAFTWYIMVEEERPGLDALMVSRLYVQGHWWATLLKLSLLALPLALLALIPYAGPVLLFFLSPFFFFYNLNIYRDLKQACGQAESGLGCTCLWLPLALAGILLPILGFVGAAAIWGPQFPEKIRHILQTSGLPIMLEQQQVQESPPLVQTVSSVDGFSIWRLGHSNSSLAQIKEVSVLGEEGELHLNITLTRPLADYFADIQQTKFDRFITFYLDLDLNAVTGSTPFLAEEGRSGYDLEVEILLAREEEGRGAGQAYVSLYRLDGENRNFVEQLHDQNVHLEEQQVQIRIGYAQFNARLGQTIKICFLEATQGLAQDKVVPLK